VKCVGIPYQPSEDVLRLLEAFRDMVNQCIRIGLEKRITSRFRLTREVYYRLMEYGYHSWYVLSAIEVATAILKNYRKAERRSRRVKAPRARKLMAKIGNQAVKVVDGMLRIPLKPRQYLYIQLHKRARSLLEECRVCSVTLTSKAIYVAFSRTVKVEEPKGWIAVDVNEDNVTVVSSDGEVKVFDLSKLKEAGYGYFERKRSLQRRYHKDRRVLKKALSKLSKNYRNKVSTMLHQASKRLVEWCKEKNYGLIHEDWKGLRKTVNAKAKRFNKFNGKVQRISKRSNKFKRRLNNWWFRKFLNQISYKCSWKGVKAIKSRRTKGSSFTCPICGFRLRKYPNGQVECIKCRLKENRNVVACLNLLRWEVAVQPQPPLKCSCERRPNEAPKPMRISVESRRGEAT